MTNKEALAKFKKILFGEERVPEKFEDITLADDSVISVEPALEVGAVANVTNADGSVTPLPDGEYELADGRTIVVSSGVIDAINDPVQGEEMTAEDIAKLIEDLTANFSKKLKEQEDKFNAKLQEFKTKNNEVQKSLVDTLEVFAKTPSEPTPKKKSGVIINKKKNLFVNK